VWPWPRAAPHAAPDRAGAEGPFGLLPQTKAGAGAERVNEPAREWDQAATGLVARPVETDKMLVGILCLGILGALIDQGASQVITRLLGRFTHQTA